MNCEKMIEFNRVFIDTAPFIYYLEKNPEYFGRARDFFLYCYENQKSIIMSVITVEEYLVFPYSIKDNELIDNFNKFLLALGIHVVDIDRRIAEKAASIRASFKNFKGMDSLQLAAAIVYDCDLFLTNDRQLFQFKEINCRVL